jgi:cell wall-associated NlpC family hydrolase
LQEQGTCFRAGALLPGRSTRLALRIMLVFAVVAFAATGAEARHVAATPPKPAPKKQSLQRRPVVKKTFKAKNSELPARVLGKYPTKTQPGSGMSRLRAEDNHQVRSELEKYLGTRYKRGGTGSGGFDCSGFARSMYRKLFGIELPHNAQSQFQLPEFTKLNSDSLRTGDLVFFSPTAKKNRINHVGIYLNDGQFIHAESNRGIIISSIDEAHWRDRLVSAKGLDSTKQFNAQAFEAWSQAADEPEENDNDEESGLHVRYDAKPQRQAEQSVALKSSPSKKQQFVELDYIRPVFGKYCNLQLGSFREDFDIYDSSADVPEGLHDPYGAYSLYSYTQGIRIASDIKPFQWMSITPSFMYYNQGPELENFLMPARSFGVDMSLGSLHDAGWSLSTGLKYESLSTSALRRASRSGEPSQLDLSLTYSQRLNSRMQLSLMGQSLRSSLAQKVEDAGSASGADQRVFFMLNYNY